MTDRASIVAFIRRDAALRYGGGHAPDIEGAMERVAGLIERHEDRKRPEPTIPFEVWSKVPSVGH